MTNGFQIDSQAVQGIVTKAILDGFTSEQRNDLVTQAITHILSTPTDTPSGYGYKKQTVIEEAVGNAVRRSAVDVVREMLTEEPYLTQMRDSLTEAVANALSDNSAIQEAVAYGLATKLRIDHNN
jgi:hypothetical protein